MIKTLRWGYAFVNVKKRRNDGSFQMQIAFQEYACTCYLYLYMIKHVVTGIC